MKPLFSAIVYVALGLLLMYGILLSTRGSFTVLIATVCFYALLLGTLGCLPKKSH